LTSVPDAAQVLHFACRDSVLVHRLSERRCRIEELGGPCRPVCDTDQTCNGVCTFALRCRPEIGCVSETVTVAVGEKKVVTFYPMSPDGLPRPGSTRARLILRCRRPSRARSAASQTRTARASWATRAFSASAGCAWATSPA